MAIRNVGMRIVTICALSATLLATHRMSAEEGQSPPIDKVPPASPLLLVTAPSAAQPGAAQLVGRTLQKGAWVAMPLEAWVDPVRLRLMPAYAARSLQVAGGPDSNGVPCGAGGRSYGGVLDQAENALLFLRYDRVSVLTEELSTLARCTPEHLTREQLGRALTLKGILEVRNGKKPESLIEALAIHPASKLPQDLPAPIPAAWSKAQSEAGQRAEVTITLHLENSAPWSLSIDGLIAKEDSVRLRSGPHFLQWLDAEGRAVVGEWVRIEPAPTSVAQVWPPTELTIPSRQEVLSRLNDSALSGQIDRNLLLALHAAEGGLELHMLVPAKQPGATALLRLGVDALELVTTEHPIVAPRALRPKPVFIAGALGGLALGSALAYSFLAQQSSQDNSLPDDIETRNYRLALIAGGSAGVFAAASGVTLWWGWKSSNPGATPLVGVQGTW